MKPEHMTKAIAMRHMTHLNSVSAIDLRFALVVLPYHTEGDDSFWNLDDIEGFLILGVGFEKVG